MDLKNSTHLYRNNKMTVNDIWSLTVTPTPANDVPVVCVSINLHKLDLKEYIMLNIMVNDTTPNGFCIQTSNPSQFDPYGDKSDNFDMFPTGTHKLLRIRMEQIKRKSTREYYCDEFNEQKYTNCIDEFIKDELQCRPVWFQRTNDLPICARSDKYQKFLTIIRDLKHLKGESNCIVPNCVENTWRTQEIWTSQLENSTIFQYYAPATKVKVSTEIFTYGLFDIFNDFAGVLSLFLGVSIISFYDYIVDVSKKIYNTIKRLKVGELTVPEKEQANEA